LVVPRSTFADTVSSETLLVTMPLAGAVAFVLLLAGVGSGILTNPPAP
jgi:hypothetical protein